jgi:hypothetical protein
VTGTVISNVVDVLDIIKKDVRAIPLKIADDIKGALSESVQEPLEDVVKLGNGKTNKLCKNHKYCYLAMPYTPSTFFQ